MSATTKLEVRGHTIRTQSHFRYQIIAVFTAERAAKTRSGKPVVIIGRTNSQAVAIKRAAAYLGHDDRTIVVVDRTTGEEVYSLPKQATPTPTSLEEQVEQEEERYQEQQQFIEPEDTSGLNIDPAALFLVDMLYPNMFEARGTSDGRWNQTLPYCKVCGEMVPTPRQEAHHAGHKRDRANHNTERIRARKEQTMASKTPTITPREQGIPDVYLTEDGKKFKPGYDAKLKRDLIAAIDDLDNPNGLHTFEKSEAARILAARDWNDHLVKSRRSREAKEARAKAKAADKATAEKQKAAAKRESAKATKASTNGDDEVKPDPKPERKPRGRRGVRS